MFSLGAPSTFIPSSIFVTIILSSIIKLSAESTSPSSVNQNSFGEGIKPINSTDSPSPVSEEERLRYLDELQGETTTDSPSPVSEEERLRYLDELQAETTIIMIPTMVFLLILGVTGLVGNSLVIFVYSLKYKRSATRIIIISIAVFDLLINVLTIPGDIYTMFHMWDFDNQAFCRAYIFFGAFPTISSSLSLLAVVVIRNVYKPELCHNLPGNIVTTHSATPYVKKYRKICTPHGWQITTGNAKAISIVVTFLGVLFSIPATMMYGQQAVDTPRKNITGHICGTTNYYNETVFPLLSYSFFFILYLCSSVLLTTLYILIGRQAWKHKTRRASPFPPTVAIRIQIESNSSSGAAQSRQSQSDDFHHIKQLGSTETLDLSCTSVENLQETQSHHIDQYVVRVVDDRVEIRSPRMREIVASLQKVMSERAGVPGNHVEDLLMTHAGNVKDVDLEMDDVTTGNQAEEHPVRGSNMATQNSVAYRDVSMYDNNNCFSSTKAVLDDRLCTGNRAETTPTRDLSFYTRKQTERSKPHPSFCTQERTDKETVTSNSETDQIVALKWLDIVYCPEGDQATTNPDIVYCPEGDQATTNPDIVYCPEGDQATTNPDIVYCPEGGHCTTNPDIVYCPEGGHCTTNPDATNTGNSFTFRISPSNNLLEKADWLRNIIVEAVAKSTLRSTRFGDDAEPERDGNVELRVLENKEGEIPCNDISCLSGIQTSSTKTLKTRLKELINRKQAMLKIRTKESKPKREKLNRTTVMLFVISAIYVLGYLPHLALKVFENVAADNFESLTSTELAVHSFFLRTIFISTATNAIIYSLCDRNFRRECIGMFSCFSRQWKL